MPGILCIVVAAWNWDPFWSSALSEVEAILCLNKLPPAAKIRIKSHQAIILYPNNTLKTETDVLWGSFRKRCHYQDEKLIGSFLFVCSWLWGLQSIRLPGFPAEVCPVSYCKPTVCLFFFCAFFVSVFQMWDKNMSHVSCAVCVLFLVFLCRTGSRMSECSKRPLRKWLFSTSRSGGHFKAHHPTCFCLCRSILVF